MARRCRRGFDMKILFTGGGRPTSDGEDAAGFEARSVSLDELLAQADFVSLHLPLVLSLHLTICMSSDACPQHVAVARAPAHPL